VLGAARVHEEFESAIADCGLVVGTSSRQRHLPWELLEPRECMPQIVEAARVGNTAVVFGAERTGLTNVELARCNLLVTIPTHAEYSSLNLAMAVQVMAYEIWLATRPGAPPPPPREVPLATAEEVLRLYEHIEQVLAEIDFQDRTGRGYLMARIRRLFNRAQLDQNEMNILRGILTAVQSRRRPAGRKEQSL
jgi:TrmH family RNA methyltransferase